MRLNEDTTVDMARAPVEVNPHITQYSSTNSVCVWVQCELQERSELDAGPDGFYGVALLSDSSTSQPADGAFTQHAMTALRDVVLGKGTVVAEGEAALAHTTLWGAAWQAAP